MPRPLRRLRFSGTSGEEDNETSSFTHVVSFTEGNDKLVVTNGKEVRSWNLVPPVLEVAAKLTSDNCVMLPGTGVYAVSSTYGKARCTDIVLMDIITKQAKYVLSEDDQIIALHADKMFKEGSPIRLIVGMRKMLVIYYITVVNKETSELKIERNTCSKLVSDYEITTINGDYITATSKNGTSIVLMADTTSPDIAPKTLTIPTPLARISILTMSRNCRYIAAASRGQTNVSLFSTDERRLTKEVITGSGVDGVALTGDGALVAIVTREGGLMVVDVRTDKTLTSLRLPLRRHSPVRCNTLVEFVSDDTQLRVVTRQGLYLSVGCANSQLVQISRVVPLAE